MRVLIIDDDPGFATLLQRLLQKRGHSVEVMTSPFGAVNKVAQKPGGPDVVVLDQMMPALSGSSLLKILADHETARKVPVLLCSSLTREDIKQNLGIHPRCAFVQKGRISDVEDALMTLAASYAVTVQA